MLSEEKKIKDLRFIWDIHYKCNYLCPYCWFYDSWETLGINDIYPSLAEWIRAWDRIYDLYGGSYIEITGGEPFLYPDFCQLLKELSTKHKIRITTNLSVNKETITELVNMLNNTRVNFEISFHPLFTSIDSFLEKAVILKEKGFCNCIQFVAYPPQINMIPYLENKAKQQGLIFSVTAFWGTYNNKSYPESYSPDEKEMLKNYVKDINRIKFNVEGVSPRGKMCYAGNRFALIKGNGSVVRCGQSKPGEKIGNFLDSDFLLNKEPLPCAYDYCPCNDYSPASCEIDSQSQEEDAEKKEIASYCDDTANGCDNTCIQKKDERAGINETEDIAVSPRDDILITQETNNLDNLRDNIARHNKDESNSISSTELAKRLGSVEFSWEICYTCNYRCPYCGRWNDASAEDLYLDAMEWEGIWRRIYERYGSCNLFISGAEPATYPQFFDIVQKVSQMHTVTICTNFSWGTKEILDRNLDSQRVQITPTFHSLFANFDTFLEKAIRLKQWIRGKMVFFVAYPTQMREVDYYKKKMNENGLNFCIVPLRGKKDGYFGVVTSDEDKDKISSITDMSEDEYTYLAQKSSPKGRCCRAGFRYAFIKATGKVFPCSQSDRPLGYIQHNEFTLLKEPMVCLFDFCPYESYNLLERYRVANNRQFL